MSNITQKWNKWFAVGCSHGMFIDPQARDAALTFKERWKPKTTLHLGDFFDLAALRSGAGPTSEDSAKSISEDVSEGIDFLQELRPQHILYGNHEARLSAYAASPNAVMARAAQSVIQEIEDCAKKCKARITPYNIRTGVVKLGNTSFLHGYMFNISAIRDHAEAYGRCVHAHIHRTGEEQARNASGDTGYSLGMLASFDMEYASTRRATLSWKQGFAFGEFADNYCTVNICSRAYGEPWRLPL